MNEFSLVVTSLAVWRLSHAIVKEDGPLMLFARLRARWAVKQQKRGGLFDLVSCVACTSAWVGLVAALWPAQTVFELIGYGLAFSAVATLLELLFQKNSNAFSLVASPTSDNKVLVGRRSPSK